MIIKTVEGEYYRVYEDDFIHEDILVRNRKSYGIDKTYDTVADIIDYGDLVYTRDRFGIFHATPILKDPYGKFNKERWIKFNRKQIYKIYKPTIDGFKQVIIL